MKILTHFLLYTCVVAALNATAQTYPARSVRIIAPYPPGGGADAAARIIARALSESMRQQFVVDNKPGASGQIGTEIAARSIPDGYTLLLGSVGPNAILPASSSKVPYDAITAFSPISVIAISEYALTVHPSLPAITVKDLISLAKSRPGEIGFGSTGIAGGPHLAGELLSHLGGIKLLHVPYKGGAPVMAALLSGEVPVSFSTLPTVIPFKGNGRLRIIAVTGGKRSSFAPEIPTIAESIKGYEVTQWYGLLAPANTEVGIISVLNSEITRITSTESVKQQFAVSGAQATATTPAGFKTVMENEIVKWKSAFRSGVIKLE